MDSHVQNVYLREIEAQCRYAIYAIDILDIVMSEFKLNKKDREKREYFLREIFRALHSFLTHTSNISKIFWPVEQGKKQATRAARALHLKELLEMSDNDPIKNRDLRNHLEHYDERLDLWSETSLHKNMASDSIGDWGSIQGIRDEDVMRWYDPADKSFRFRGIRYDIHALFLAVVALHQKLSPHLKH